MRILHLSSEKTWRGGERQISFLIDELNKKNIENIVLLKKDSAFEKYCLNNRISFSHASFKNSLDIFTALKIKSVVSEKKISLVHAHTARGHGLAILASKLGMNVPIVVSKRTVFEVRNVKKYNDKSVAKVLAISNAVKDQLIADGVDHNKIRIVHSSIDPNDYEVESINFKSSKGLTSNFCIVNTSALTKEKDYPTFLRVIAKVKNQVSNIHAIIMGSGEDIESLKILTKELGINDNVTFLGFVDNPKSILKEMDLFLMTSTSEGLGSSLLDAMALEVPIVSTNAGGLKELVINNESGFSCNIADVDSLADSVLKIINSNELREKFILNSKKLLNNFSKEEMGEKTLKIYKEILTK